MKKNFFIILILLIFINIIVSAQANSVLFRFNANHDFSQNISSSVEVYDVEFNKYVDSIEATARNLYGWGYYAPIYSIFPSDSSYLKSIEKVRVTFAGDHKLSGEIWFKTESENGSLFSWNDSTQKHGIDLYLSDSKLKLERRFYDTTIVLTSNSNIELDEWTYIDWTMNINSREVILSFYINGNLDISETYTLNSDVGFAIVNSIVLVGKSEYKSEIPNYNGILSAVNFKSYISQNEYLNTKIPFDGSEYFGIPTYHNYNIGTMNEEVDQIISYNPTEIMESAIVPYMDDDFIPQGLTNSYEDKENYYVSPMVYTSLYNKNVDGVTRRKRSIVVEMDPNNDYKIRRCFQLGSELKYGHNGGLAFFNNKVYVASASKIEIYEIPEYDSLVANNKYINLTTSSSNLYTVSSIASYVTYYNDSIWVGDYALNGNGSIKGYPIDETDAVMNTVTPKKYMIPDKTQGVAWINIEGSDYLMISLSTGDGYSYIYRVPRSELSSTQMPTPEKVFIFPAGGEDLSFDKENNLYAQSESGAKYFQKRTNNPWNTFYPFIYKISYETLFGDIVSVEEDYGKIMNDSENIVSLSAYPNPTNANVNIVLTLTKKAKYHLRIVNILGQTIKNWSFISTGNGKYNYYWNADGVASGVYYLQLIADKNIYSHKILVMK
ncbi:MAG: T9SS type A sorting domain-containing protein [Bacteroidota bacterium]